MRRLLASARMPQSVLSWLWRISSARLAVKPSGSAFASAVPTVVGMQGMLVRLGTGAPVTETTQAGRVSGIAGRPQGVQARQAVELASFHQDNRGVADIHRSRQLVAPPHGAPSAIPDLQGTLLQPHMAPRPLLDNPFRGVRPGDWPRLDRGATHSRGGEQQA